MNSTQFVNTPGQTAEQNRLEELYHRTMVQLDAGEIDYQDAAEQCPDATETHASGVLYQMQLDLTEARAEIRYLQSCAHDQETHITKMYAEIRKLIPGFEDR